MPVAVVDTGFGVLPPLGMAITSITRRPMRLGTGRQWTRFRQWPSQRTNPRSPMDNYAFRARVLPVVIVVLPAVAMVASGLLAGSPFGIATGLSASALGALAAQLGRDRGKRLESRMWRRWGGSPTTQLLRYQSRPTAEVERLHTAIQGVLGIAMPTVEDEQVDPRQADVVYEEAIRVLRARTRDSKKFHLVFEENVNYGFRRNCLGLRVFGIGVATLAIVVSVGVPLVACDDLSAAASQWGLALGMGALLGGFWIFLVNENWVRVPAEAYAERLLEAVAVLDR